MIYSESSLELRKEPLTRKNTKNWKEAKEIMRPHYKEAEFYNKNICRKGLEISSKDLERSMIAKERGISIYEVGF